MNTMLEARTGPRRTIRRIGGIAGALLLALASGGCDSLLEVTDPDIVTPASLQSESGIATVRAGALGDLAIAMNGAASGHGATVGLTLMSGTMSDEYDY